MQQWSSHHETFDEEVEREFDFMCKALNDCFWSWMYIHYEGTIPDPLQFDQPYDVEFDDE